MGGIAGIYHIQTAKPVDPERIRAMTDMLVHRGTDGSGVWAARGVGLGHCRLAITDLAAGAQPMADASGALVVVLDGAIYNAPELRTDLERLGHVFRTGCDAEVILHGWRQWREDCLHRVNGMFAFALFDAREQCLFLARDRLGGKPLHYATLSDGSVAFASELKGLLAHPLLRRKPDLRAVEDYLGLGYVPDDSCIVEGVAKLPAGHWLRLERSKPLARPVCWWDVDFSARAEGSAARLEEEMVERLRAAVTARMIADVPLGALLSGGADSASVVALMAEASGRAVKTCSVGFDVSEFDETSHADRVARRFATDHRACIVSADDVALIDRLAEGFDEPFGDGSALPTYRLCQLAGETVKVVLSGDGADEIFAGYRRYRFLVAEERARAVLSPRLKRFAGQLGTLYPKADWAPRPFRAKTSLLALAQNGAEAYAHAVGVTDPVMRARLYADGVVKMLDGHHAEDRYLKAMQDAPARDALDRAQYADLKIALPGDILTKLDRASMAAGVEIRAPLLDHHLVEFAARLPSGMRLRRGTGKWLMKKAMARYLPGDILHRRKMGFVAPISSWFRGPLADQAVAIARSPALGETGWFRPEVIARLAADHRAGLGDHGRLLWQLLMLDRSLTRLFGLGA